MTHDTRTADEKLAGPIGTEDRDRRQANEKLATDPNYVYDTEERGVRKHAHHLHTPTPEQQAKAEEDARNHANPAWQRLQQLKTLGLVDEQGNEIKPGTAAPVAPVEEAQVPAKVPATARGIVTRKS